MNIKLDRINLLENGFSMVKKQYGKTKHLHSISIEGVQTHTTCHYGLNTDKITISTTFHRSYGNNGTKTNRNCSDWLGNRAETILMNMFNDVKRMSHTNPGFDFLCGKGYKIDAKSACLYKNQYNKYNSWLFNINYNTTADHFLCLALDNRTDLNPLHVWLIPGYVINNHRAVSISKSTIDKWSKYEQPLDKVITCCNTMKGDSK